MDIISAILQNLVDNWQALLLGGAIVYYKMKD